MSLERCLPEMFERGEITREQMDRMRELFDEAKGSLAGKMSPEAMAAAASDQALTAFRDEAALRKRQSLLQVAAQNRIMQHAASFKGPKRGEAFIATLVHSDQAPYQNAEALQRVIQLQAHGMMEGVLKAHSRNLLGGVRNRAQLHNVVREAFGENTQDIAARELADAWSQTAEMLRVRFNAAGGAIGKLEKWGLPQVHDYQAVRDVSYGEWRDFIAPLLDHTRMKDPLTGMPMSPQGLELALRASYETISSDGWAARKPGSMVGMAKLANRRADPRFLIFKDADSWMAYAKRFGRPQSGVAGAIDPDGPIFDAMMGHIHNMSREIALMETLGPNPTATVRWMGDVLEREAKTNPGDRYSDASIRRSIGTLNDIYAEMSGGGKQPIATRIGTWFGAARAMQVAGKLGSATVSALTDIGFQATTRAFNGMPVTKALTGYMRQFNPLSSSDRELAARIGFGAEAASRSAVAQSRFTGEVLTGEVASRLAEGVLRASGLSAWTEAGKRAFGVDLLSHVTGERNKSWGQLHGGWRSTLERYGFNERSWDELRQTPLTEHGGAKWIMPHAIENRELRERLLGLILTETRFAVPEADVRTQALLNQNMPPKGTLMGEIVRSPFQFKSFGISMLLSHGRRMMEQQTWGKLRYAAGLALTTGLMGALVYGIAKPLLRGEDPMATLDEDTGISPTFLAQALAQGGGFGLAGDFLTSATDRYDNALDEFFLGPLYGDVKDAIGAVRQGVKAARGESNSAGKKLVRLIQGDIPGGSLWYAKLAFNRAVGDQAMHWADPNYYDSVFRMEKRARENGQEYWWRPGEGQPSRAPDLANVLEERPPTP